MLSIFQSTFNPSFQKIKVAWKLKNKSQKSTSSSIRGHFLHWHQGLQKQQPNQAEKQGRTSAVPFIHGAFQGDRGTLPWAASTERVHVQTHDCNHILGITSLSAPWKRLAKALLWPWTAARLWSALQRSPWETADLHPAGQEDGRVPAKSPGPELPHHPGCSVAQCWQLLPSNGPGDGFRLEVAHRQLVPGGMRLWIGITPPKSWRCWLRRRASKGSCNVEKTSSGALRRNVLESEAQRKKPKKPLSPEKD